MQKFVALVAEEITQFSEQFKKRLISQLINDIPSILQKLLKYFNGNVTTQVYRKENKKAVPWVSKILKRYKRNTISGDLHRSRKKASNSIRAIKAKCNKAGYPRRFIETVIRDFITPLDKDESFIIPPNMFAVKKPFLLLEIPYCEQNEIASKRSIKKFHQFTGDRYDIAVKWLTKNVK